MSHIIARENQKLEQDAVVEMFELDARMHGDGVLRFTSGPINGEPVRFNGYEFMPIPIQAEGFKWDGQGTPPRPTLRISAMDPTFLSLVRAAGDLVGTPFRRLRTFRRFLDDGDDPDPEALFPVDYFVIERKASQNSVMIEFELSVEVDQQGKKIPARQILRDSCTHTYRRWDGTKFNYERVTCPYTGSKYFDISGVSVVHAGEDECGKRLSDCQARFGSKALPFYGFPGVGRIR